MGGGTPGTGSIQGNHFTTHERDEKEYDNIVNVPKKIIPR